jgi:hypothetical protein
MKSRAVIALVLACALAIGAAACSDSGQSAPDAAGGGETLTLDGATLLEARCTTCHNLDRVDAQDLDFAGWVAVIQRMIDKGARLSAEEKTVLADYLANR